MELFDLIADARIIPTLRLTHAEEAPPLLAALCSGGITAAAISLRTDAAYDVLRQGCRLFPDLILGAWDVYTSAEANRAIQSGARIISTPGFSEEINRLCKERDSFYLPICLTPTELLIVQNGKNKAAGIFSPETFGGLALISALKNSFPHLPFVADSIPIDRISAYLALPDVIACTCSEIIPGSYEEIIEKCKKAVRQAGSIRF